MGATTGFDWGAGAGASASAPASMALALRRAQGAMLAGANAAYVALLDEWGAAPSSSRCEAGRRRFRTRWCACAMTALVLLAVLRASLFATPPTIAGCMYQNVARDQRRNRHMVQWLKSQHQPCARQNAIVTNGSSPLLPGWSHEPGYLGSYLTHLESLRRIAEHHEPKHCTAADCWYLVFEDDASGDLLGALAQLSWLVRLVPWELYAVNLGPRRLGAQDRLLDNLRFVVQDARAKHKAPSVGAVLHPFVLELPVVPTWTTKVNSYAVTRAGAAAMLEAILPIEDPPLIDQTILIAEQRTARRRFWGRLWALPRSGVGESDAFASTAGGGGVVAR